MPTTAGCTSERPELKDPVMSIALQPLAGTRTQAARQRASEPEAFWRSLVYFNIYRLACALVLLVMAATWSSAFPFGSRDYALFVSMTACYSLFSLVCFVLIRIRWRFDLQLSIQIAADVVAIGVLTYASNGISSGLGLLLLTSLAAAGLVARGRLTLFYAALASIVILLEHTYEVLRFDAPVPQYAQAGLLAAAYFAIAWLAHTLARYAVASEELAAQREIDLENMAQVSEHVIQDMQDGVLVVDGVGVIRQFNMRAERILGPLWGRRDVPLRQYSAPLARRFQAWREDEHGNVTAGEMTVNGAVGARFVPVGRSRSAGAVIFVEDLTRIQAEARQMKLAALGRLTANIAHEIRNPLGAISHAAELLQEEPAINDTVKRLTTIIQDNSQRLDRMVDDVLRLRRGDSAHRETFGVVDYLKTFVEEFCQIEKIPADIFQIELGADPDVSFDRSHLNQVMWNLCRNAIRHCRREHGSIRVVVALDRRDAVVKLDVIDDGPGVPLVLRTQLFEPFFTTAARGTGLGLYIAREVCEANGAKLDYIETDSGAQFRVLCRAGSNA
ncbi:MAG: integral rane sensor signal transduction histidine kinase [Betaproteobacteria bacterium]|nr:integral rane sensor signal transduction histidine kinase [Betaproteobacteria bacterium]